MANAKYSWDKWFSRKQTVLRKGAHFNCQVHCMAIQSRANAKMRGLHVKVLIHDDEIKIVNLKK